MYKIDLHTHSQASPDGALSADDYRRMLASGKLDYIAVTDHNRIDFAVELQAQLGRQIIIGEEITTMQGEIIGLYLARAVSAGLSLTEAVTAIHEQGGLVYIPHPFETVRKGITTPDLSSIAAEVDIIETYNGRTLQNKANRAITWAAKHKVPGAASSDAHGWIGWGKTYSVLLDAPTRENLLEQLAMATGSHGSVGIRGRLYPKLNRLRRRTHA